MNPSHLLCPHCSQPLLKEKDRYYCSSCKKSYYRTLFGEEEIVNLQSPSPEWECRCSRDGETLCQVDLRKYLNSYPFNKSEGNPSPGIIFMLEKFLIDRSRILDVGCGEGIYAKAFPKDSHKVGLDICPKRMLKYEEDNAINRGYNLLVLHDAQTLPFPDEEFDAIVCLEVIEHIERTRQFLRECHRVLGKGDLLILSTPNLASLPKRLSFLFGRCKDVAYPDNYLHIRFFTFKSLHRLFKEERFHVRWEMGLFPTRLGINKILSKTAKNFAVSLALVAEKGDSR